MSCPANHNPTWEDVWSDILKLDCLLPNKHPQYIYGIPRGGAVVASLLAYVSRRYRLDQRVLLDTTLVDDVIESGATLQRQGYSHNMYVLYSKMLLLPTNVVAVHHCNCTTYIRFPWESMETEHDQENDARSIPSQEGGGEKT